MSHKAPIAIIFLLLLTLMSSVIGVADINWSNIFSADFDWTVLLYSRLPRSLAILLTGSSLAVAGLMMQILLGNRFVEPSMVGTVQGASLGLLLMVILFPAASLLLKMSVATLFAIGATFFFLFLIRHIPPTDKMMVPLIGIIYSGIIGAAAGFIAYEADMLQALESWMHGEFSGVLLGRFELLWLSLAMSILAYISADKLTIASLGESMSVGLGLNFKQVLRLGLAVVSIITATIVVTIGGIPFLGLVVPNIISRMMGDNLRFSLPWVAYLGAVLLLVCDILARVIIFPYELSVSLILGIIGTVLFLYLLMGARRHAR